MNDMTIAILPKSDQLNADDLFGGAKTFTIKSATVDASADQMVSVYFHGHKNKPYKPCKSMCRVMARVWGMDTAKYAGHSLTLYRDPSVKFGGVEVGGIRIRAMSGITKTITMGLALAKGRFVSFTVLPLAQAGQVNPTDLLKRAGEAADRGLDAYKAFHTGLTPAEKASLSSAHEGFKKRATEKDMQAVQAPPIDEEMQPPALMEGATEAPI